MRARLTLGSVEFLFTLFLTVCMFLMAVGALEFSVRARYFPLTMGVIGTLAGAASLVIQTRERRKRRRQMPDDINSESSATTDPNTPPIERVGANVVLLVGFLVGIAIVGVQVASIVLIFGTQYLLAKVGLLKSLLATAVCLAVLLLLGQVTSIRWPEALLPQLFKGLF